MLPSDDRTPESELLTLGDAEADPRGDRDVAGEVQIVMILRYLQDLSLQEISDVLDMPVTTVKTRVHRGREFLRKKLEHKL